MEFVPLSDNFRQIGEGEAYNFASTTKSLGATAELVDDFDRIYGDLVQFIKISSDVVKTEDQATAGVCGLHLAMRCRNSLVMGCLQLFRGYHGLSLTLLRAAIEACAFAVRIAKHPHLAEVWLNSSDSDESYKDYKERFTKLFPADDPILSELYYRFHRCSKMVHNSIFSMTGHFSYERTGTQQTLSFNVFDLPSGHMLPSALFYCLDTHKRILERFGQAFVVNIGSDFPTWNVRLNAALTKLDLHREEWKKVIPDPRQFGTP